MGRHIVRTVLQRPLALLCVPVTPQDAPSAPPIRALAFASMCYTDGAEARRLAYAFTVAQGLKLGHAASKF